jgi:hypothetical protein
MTETEKLEIVTVVLQALRTNSLSIEQLINVKELPDDGSLEISGGRKISCADLKLFFKSFLPGLDLVGSFGERVDAAIHQAFFTKVMKENQHRFLSESEYEELKELDSIDPDLIYMIYEEE